MAADTSAAGAGVDRFDRISAGDERAISEFVERYGDRLYNFVYQRVGQRQEDAEDITYDTFLAATRSASAFRGDSAVFTWLCGIARRKIAGHYRTYGRHRRIPSEKIITMEDLGDLRSDAESPHEIAVRMQSRVEIVRSVVETMREAEAEVLVMKYALEMDVREIAETIGRTPKAAESLLSRARESFRAAYTIAIREYEGELQPDWARSPEPGG